MRRWLLPLVALAGCGDRLLPPTVVGLQSFQVIITDPPPAGLGTPAMPAQFTDLTLDVKAVDSTGATFEQDIDVDVYVSYAGNKIGTFTACGNNEDSTPLTTIHLLAGRAQGAKLTLPRAYGVTNLWLEQTPPARSKLVANQVQSHALGASPTIYFPNPTIPAIQTPLDINAPNATFCTPFNGKHVIVDHGSGQGQLVVSSVFINGYVIADTGALFDPMTGLGGFNHLYVFSFGRPPREIEPGRIMNQISGNVSKFVGFTELNFPLQSSTVAVDPQLIPPAYELRDQDQTQNLRLIRLVGATVHATSVRICPIDQNTDDWRKFNQFLINFAPPLVSVCDPFSSFSVSMPGKQLGNFDPLKIDPINGRINVTGMLRNFSGQNETLPHTECTTNDVCTAIRSASKCVDGVCKNGAFNFWLITPRNETDITVN